jgi:hypothetical protein
MYEPNNNSPKVTVNCLTEISREKGSHKRRPTENEDRFSLASCKPMHAFFFFLLCKRLNWVIAMLNDVSAVSACMRSKPGQERREVEFNARI